MNRSLLAAAVAISGLISLPTWASPQLIWELDGLEAPESALADPEAGVIYVSNVAGDPSAKDGNGYISRVALDGKMLEQRWAIGLDAPKGLILRGDTLFVSDVDRLVAIDTATGKIGGTWTAEGAKFLNDTAVDGQGRIYVSDMLDDAIWVLDGDKFQLFVRDKALTAPNGLFVDFRPAAGRGVGHDGARLVHQGARAPAGGRPRQQENRKRVGRHTDRQPGRPGARRERRLADDRLDLRRPDPHRCERTGREAGAARARQRRPRHPARREARAGADDERQQAVGLSARVGLVSA